MDPKIEAALLRAVCTLIDKGEFALGTEDAETPEELAIVSFMVGLRIGSRARYGGTPNTWKLDIPTRFECDCCGKCKPGEPLAIVSGAPWCISCTSARSVVCEGCNVFIDGADMHGPQGETLCRDCADRLERNK